MQFLKQYWITLKEFFHKTNIEIPKVVTPNEPLGRYLLYSKWFKSDTHEVFSSAFLPPDDLKLSVFRTNGLTENDIWEIGKKEVMQKLAAPRTLYGRAEIKALKVQETGLSIEPDNIPPRHANIVGWPKEKSERKSIALQLAKKENAKLILRQETEKTY